MASVALVANYVTRLSVQDKLPLLATPLTKAGYDVLYLCWHEACGPLYHKAAIPSLSLTFTKQPFDVLPVVPAFVKYLSRPVLHDPDTPAPTWGELLGYDDFIGCAQSHKIGGAAALRPDLVIAPVAGAESSTPEDAMLDLAVYRFCTQNHIPRIALECNSLTNDLRLTQWPADILLTKDDPRDRDYSWIAPQTYRMDTPTRYALSLGQEKIFDDFFAAEPMLRDTFGGPGTHYVHLAFHIGYKANFASMVQAIQPYIPVLKEAGFKLLISFTPDHYRKNINEQQMIGIGLRRWLNDWGDSCIIIGGFAHAVLAILADAVLAPNESVVTEFARRWGIPVIRPGEEQKLEDLAVGVSLPEIVSWVLKPAEEKQAA
jgi:hypothetical protein